MTVACDDTEPGLSIKRHGEDPCAVRFYKTYSLMCCPRQDDSYSPIRSASSVFSTQMRSLDESLCSSFLSW